jgi:hypothetical protein
MNPMTIRSSRSANWRLCPFVVLAYPASCSWSGALRWKRSSSPSASATAVGSLAQVVAMMRASDPAMGGMWNSLWFNLLFTIPRPWVMLVVAVCALRLVKRIPEEAQGTFGD